MEVYIVVANENLIFVRGRGALKLILGLQFRLSKNDQLDKLDTGLPPHSIESRLESEFTVYLVDKRVPHSRACSDVGLHDVAELLDGFVILQYADILQHTHTHKDSKQA